MAGLRAAVVATGGDEDGSSDNRAEVCLNLFTLPDYHPGVSIQRNSRDLVRDRKDGKGACLSCGCPS